MVETKTDFRVGSTTEVTGDARLLSAESVIPAVNRFRLKSVEKTNVYSFLANCGPWANCREVSRVSQESATRRLLVRDGPTRTDIAFVEFVVPDAGRFEFPKWKQRVLDLAGTFDNMAKLSQATRCDSRSALGVHSFPSPMLGHLTI